MKDLNNWDLIVDKLQSAVLDIIKHFEFKLSSKVGWMGLMFNLKNTENGFPTLTLSSSVH